MQMKQTSLRSNYINTAFANKRDAHLTIALAYVTVTNRSYDDP